MFIQETEARVCPKLVQARMAYCGSYRDAEGNILKECLCIKAECVMFDHDSLICKESMISGIIIECWNNLAGIRSIMEGRV